MLLLAPAGRSTLWSPRSSNPRIDNPGRRRSRRIAPRRLTMPQWEYSKIDLNNVPTNSTDLDTLDDAGRAGWELVSTTPNNFAYLKRPGEDAAAPAPRAKPAARRRATA